MKNICFFFFFLTLTYCSSSNNDNNKGNSDRLYIASWNVENLFDAIDDADKIDEWFLPSSKINWTDRKLATKLKNLAKVISLMNDGEGPDILALQEVEHKHLIEKLVREIKSDKNYKIVHFESPDKRGIDNAIIYNSNILSLNLSEAIRVNLKRTTTRDILYVELLYRNEGIHIFVNHWSSRREGLKKTEPKRIAAAKTLLKKISSIKNLSKKNIVILGDFNDLPVNISIKKILKAKDFNCDSIYNDFKLFNLTLKSFKQGLGTYKYKDNWNMLDQMIISNSLLNKIGLDYYCNSFEIIKPKFIIQKNGKYKGTALPTFGGKKYLGGYSDHFPIGAKFIYK
ncbi:MAG: endonuclease [Ignavibacteriae bacterium]|nr:MAG: endonuclease [Ignavibacteriota bacterium]